MANKLHTGNTLMLAEVLEMFGPLNPQVLIRASMQLTHEFDTLRLCIVEHEGVPSQVVLPEYNGTIPYFDVSSIRLRVMRPNIGSTKKSASLKICRTDRYGIARCSVWAKIIISGCNA